MEKTGLEQNELDGLVKKYVREIDFPYLSGIDSNIKISFLAQGEYNINYLLEMANAKFVLRLNTGSQMDLENQISYEYRALEYLEDSSVTPVPFYLDDSRNHIPFGVLVMSYLSGRSLEYKKDLLKAARTLAVVHNVEITDNTDLIRVENPLAAIWQECNKLIEVYLKSPLATDVLKDRLKYIREKMFGLQKKEKGILDLLPLSIVNTEVNSGNFIVNEKENITYLVDWEKPLITTPIQDLSHFMVPTTTLWKTEYCFSESDRENFIRTYLQERKLASGYGGKGLYDKLFEALEVFNKFSIMRGLSWSAMAWVEYQSPDRMLKNEDTFKKIESYLEPGFIDNLYPDI
ncbi:MAG: aminoglycoside phosphotransferase family protein [Halanaerobiales bacterium]